MSLVTIVGDCTTTTALAVAAEWPVSDDPDVVVVEADRAGGSLTAWLDTPSTPTLSTIVASGLGTGSAASPSWANIEPMTQRSSSGIRFIAAPIRQREAASAIGEASRQLIGLFASPTGPTVLLDCGRHPPIDVLAMTELATTALVVHRQATTSPAAASVRLDRLSETVTDMAQAGLAVEVAVIGDRPFGLDEITQLVTNDGELDTTVHHLANDPLAAAVLAGRGGVSARRLSRLPLMRSARNLAAALDPEAETLDNETYLSHSGGC